LTARSALQSWVETGFQHGLFPDSWSRQDSDHGGPSSASSPAPTTPSPPPSPPQTPPTSLARAHHIPPSRFRPARSRRNPPPRCRVQDFTTPGIFGVAPDTSHSLPLPFPLPSLNQAWPHESTPSTAPPSPLCAPPGDAAPPWEGSPCFISFSVGAWSCYTWAQPCSGGWLVPSFLGCSS
jgi:hypothetical protein